MNIRTELNDLKATITTISAFLSSLLRKARILISDKVPTAGVTDRYEIVINEEFFKKLSFRAGCWVLLHELLHMGFLHYKRRGGSRDPELWNIAADMVVNELLAAWINEPDELNGFTVREWTVESIIRSLGYEPPSDLAEMSVEEVYDFLEKIMPRKPDEIKCPQCGSKNIVCRRYYSGTQEAEFECTFNSLCEIQDNQVYFEA